MYGNDARRRHPSPKESERDRLSATTTDLTDSGDLRGVGHWCCLAKTTIVCWVKAIFAWSINTFFMCRHRWSQPGLQWFFGRPQSVFSPTVYRPARRDACRFRNFNVLKSSTNIHLPVRWIQTDQETILPVTHQARIDSLAMDPAALAGITIYNLPPSPPNWDRLGVFYVSFCATWTTLVLAGMVFCWVNRQSPILKLRGLPLSFTAILFLHAYWILAQITYPIGATMPVLLAYDIQYFFMGIWFPLGIALFHASNSRLLHVAKLQKLHFARGGDGVRRKRTGCDGASSSWLCRLRNASYSTRIMVPIGLGMVFQVLLTVGMWAACKKYHPSFGIPGTEIEGSNVMEQLVDLGRGWEWWPSVLWQVIWTWIVAPILLWRSWGIRDTMGWRTQTIGCCVSSLHATPMFMIASYVPAFINNVNPYFAPSQWIHLSLLMFEVFTVFVPAFQVIRLRALSQEAMDANEKWDTSSQPATLRPSSAAISSLNRSRNATSSSQAEKGLVPVCHFDSGGIGPEPDSRLLTMSALDHTLRENQGSLQEFSALSDFSGENIAFLTRVAAWTASPYHDLPGRPAPQSLNSEGILDAYNRALDIYADFVSLTLAEFPVNLPCTELRRLNAVFERPAHILYGHGDDESLNAIVPFDDSQTLDRNNSGSGSGHGQRSQVRYTGEIPDGFDLNIFDSAEGHIKYLVLTNTWPKFVKEMHQRRRSSETGRSVTTASSQTSLLDRMSTRVSGFFRSVL